MQKEIRTHDLQKRKDPRFEKINELFVNYSMGNFDYKVETSKEFDEIDAFISSVNMLGEELKYSTISRDYFNNIFNSVSDMLFVLNRDGIINNVNKTVLRHLHYSENEIRKKSINSLMVDSYTTFDHLCRKLQQSDSIVEVEMNLLSAKGYDVPVDCLCTYLYDQAQQKIGYLFIARDKSNIKKYERSLWEAQEKYRRISEESSDPIFVISNEGTFLELNKAGLRLFKCSKKDLAEMNFFETIFYKEKKELFCKKMKEQGMIVDFKIKFRDFKNGNIIACLVSSTSIRDENGVFIGYQGIIKDISKQKQMENLVIRTIVDTQEKERKRFAQDLHDSLGQQLSAIKFYLATLNSGSQLNNKRVKEMLNKSNYILDNVLSELRNICFNLMPGTLQNFGLSHAIVELCKKMEFNNVLEFDICISQDLPKLHNPLEIAIFRIVQEFINNAITHGDAKQIGIRMNLSRDRSKLIIGLSDNGKGFAVKDISEEQGMGLKNVRSRIRSYNGYFQLRSEPGKGTKYQIEMPIINTARTNEKNKNISR